MAARAQSEYEKFEMSYGRPDAPDPGMSYKGSLALMEGDRVLGGTVHGKGLADVAKARATAGALGNANGIGGPGGGGGSPESLKNQALKEAQKKYDAALAANEKTEAELKKGYAERRLKAEKSLEKTGAAAIADVNAHFDKLVGAARAQMNASGTGQTSIATTTIAGIEKERAKALASLYDQQTMQKVGLDTQLSGDELQLAERVQNEYPDMGKILEAAKLDGKGTQDGLGGGGGFGFGGGVGSAYGVGMGGAASIGTPYGVNPFGFGFDWGGAEGAAATGKDSRGLTAAQREQNRQNAYGAMRGQKLAASALRNQPGAAPSPMAFPNIPMPTITTPMGQPSPTLSVPGGYSPSAVYKPTTPPIHQGVADPFPPSYYDMPAEGPEYGPMGQFNPSSPYAQDRIPNYYAGDDYDYSNDPFGTYKKR